MKKGTQTLMVAIGLFIASCTKIDNAQPVLSINYPAAYVVNGTSSTLSIINLNTNEVANLIQLTDDVSGMTHNGGGKFLQYPHHVYLNPAKNQIAIAAPGIDLSGGHGIVRMEELLK